MANIDLKKAKLMKNAVKKEAKKEKESYKEEALEKKTGDTDDADKSPIKKFAFLKKKAK